MTVVLVAQGGVLVSVAGGGGEGETGLMCGRLGLHPPMPNEQNTYFR